MAVSPAMDRALMGETCAHCGQSLALIQPRAYECRVKGTDLQDVIYARNHAKARYLYLRMIREAMGDVYSFVDIAVKSPRRRKVLP